MDVANIGHFSLVSIWLLWDLYELNRRCYNESETFSGNTTISSITSLGNATIREAIKLKIKNEWKFKGCKERGWELQRKFLEICHYFHSRRKVRNGNFHLFNFFLLWCLPQPGRRAGVCHCPGGFLPGHHLLSGCWLSLVLLVSGALKYFYNLKLKYFYKPHQVTLGSEIPPGHSPRGLAHAQYRGPAGPQQGAG